MTRPYFVIFRGVFTRRVLSPPVHPVSPAPQPVVANERNSCGAFSPGGQCRRAPFPSGWLVFIFYRGNECNVLRGSVLSGRAERNHDSSGLDLEAEAEEGFLGAASRRSSPHAVEGAAICRTLDSEGLEKAGAVTPDDLRKFFSPVWDHSLDCPHALGSRRWLAGGKRQLGALTSVSLIDLRTQKRRRQRNLRKLPLSRYGRSRDRKRGSFNLSAKRFL